MKTHLLYTALVSVAIAAGLTQGQAQTRVNFSGTYSIKGTNPDGTVYNGTMAIAEFGDGYRVTQTFSDGTVYRGIGNDMGNYLTVAYQWGNVPSISIYKITQSNALEGFWQDYDNDKEGSETAVVTVGPTFFGSTAGITGSRYDYTGVYTVNGTNPDNTTYTGSMAVSAFGDGYRVTQTFTDGSVWRGIASYIEDYLAVSYQTNNGPLVTIYQRDRNGSSLNGYWQLYTNPREGKETAVKR